MALRLGDPCPDFTGESQLGPISFHAYKHNTWAILFSHPADFTPVCTTELGAVQRLLPEFQKRNVKVVGLSVDTVVDHNAWINDINEVNHVHVAFPILADKDRKVAQLYNMLDTRANDPTNVDQHGMPMTVRSVFFIDPAHKIRCILTYPASCGRNFTEILRIIDSLQLTDKHRVTTPADWVQGGQVIVHPGVSDEQATELFGEFTKVKPYLRFTTLKD